MWVLKSWKWLGNLTILRDLDLLLLQEFAIDMISASLSKEYKQFALNYNMNNTEQTIAKLKSWKLKRHS